MNEVSRTPPERVNELVALYSDRAASTAHFLCDRHDPTTVAYTLIGSDLAAADLSYGELRDDSMRLASALSALGLEPGDRIATLMGKSREYLTCVMAIWRLGGVHVPLFTAFAPAAIAFRLRASQSKLVLCDSAQHHKFVQGEELNTCPTWSVVTLGCGGPGTLTYDELLSGQKPRFDPAVLGGDAPIVQIYTSGTTGSPKGVIVPLRALAGFHVYLEYGLYVGRHDVFWNAADPGWAYGLYYGVLAPLAAGVRSLMLIGGFSVEATFAVLERFGVTNFAAAPTVYRALRASGTRANAVLNLRCASSAGEPLTPEVNQWSREAIGCQVHDHYGQTETGMLINNHHHPVLRRPLRTSSMGYPMPGWEVTILTEDGGKSASGEVGRVAIDLAASPLAWFAGYVGEPQKSNEKFSTDGRWYITGDLGRIDDDGYFYFAARDDDVIIMAGYRIGPNEVESVILTHPAVAECAVVAAPDEVRGEVLEAVVVLMTGFAGSDELTSEIKERVKQGYAAHAYPRRVHYASALPKTPSGKVQRFLVRRQLPPGD